MTRRGIVLVIAAAVLFVLADFTRTGWVQLSDALLWGAIVLSFVLAMTSVPAISVTYRLARRPGAGPGPTEGDDGVFAITVRNRLPWPRFGLLIKRDLLVNGGAGQTLRLYIPFVGPWATATVDGVLPLVRHGLHEVHGLTVQSEAPFGLFRRRRRIAGHASLLVYPAPHPLDPQEKERLTSGEAPLPRSARWGEETSGSRPYAFGDLARDVHWRNFARTGQLMTRSYVATITPSPELVYSAEARDTEILDDVVRLVTGAARLWSQGDNVILLQSGTTQLSLAWEDLLRHLALATPGSVAPVGESLRALAPDATVIAVLPASDTRGIASVASHLTRVAGMRVLLLDDSPEGATGLAVAASLGQAGAVVHRVRAPLSSKGQGEPGMAA